MKSNMTMKKEKTHDVLLEMQQTHLARAVNIRMHMALWTPKSKEKASSGGGQDVVPFANFEPVDESHFYFFKKPAPRKGQPMTPFPAALVTIYTEEAAVTKSLLHMCKQDNCTNTNKTVDEIQKLHNSEHDPTLRRYQIMNLHHTGDCLLVALLV
jgi:hypothetical protein